MYDFRFKADGATTKYMKYTRGVRENPPRGQTAFAYFVYFVVSKTVGASSLLILSGVPITRGLACSSWRWRRKSKIKNQKFPCLITVNCRT
jgi:hypothetical protein